MTTTIHDLRFAAKIAAANGADRRPREPKPVHSCNTH